MNTYSYAAVDSRGKETKGTLQVADQAEAIQRLKDMGFFPTRVSAGTPPPSPLARAARHARRLGLKSRSGTPTARAAYRGRLKPRRVAVFTRQMATLLEAGMPLLRGLRLLQEQETNAPLKRVVGEIALTIEGGSTLSEALGQYPRIFNRLYVNMIRAGELGGDLETSLQRLAGFMEKAGKLKAKVKAAMCYPVAVLTVAFGVMALLTLYVLPKFKEVFAGLSDRGLPPFTQWVLNVSDGVRSHFIAGLLAVAGLVVVFRLALGTRTGREVFDQFKLRLPVFGPLNRKLAIARFTRTLGTLITSGVPILQALTIVKEATGNLIMGRLVGQVHENVKQGESIVGPLRNSGIFPALVAGMVDVGEQTGALPEMLTRIADDYEEEVDNSVAAMVSLLEPVMIVFLAVVVGSIVIAMFLPIIQIGDISGGNADAAGAI